MNKVNRSLLNTARYDLFVKEIERLLTEARRQTARSVNAILTATYWEIGRRIVEFEQGGGKRADYGEAILQRLSEDLTRRIGRGFSSDNLELMRRFYLSWPWKSETPSRKFTLADLARAFPLSWSHYARLLKISKEQARAF